MGPTKGAHETPEEVIAAELNHQEKLLWAGRPPLGVRFCWLDLFYIPLTTVWFAGIVVGVAIAIVAGVPFVNFLYLLAVVPFVIVGAYFTVGRFFHDAKARARTYYVVTSERVIIISGIFRRRTKSFYLDRLDKVTLRERRDGS